MNQPIKTVFVTDVPFWKRESGAQLRIDQLIDNLSCENFQSSVLVTQTPIGFDLESVDCEAPIKLLDPSIPPTSGLGVRLRWQLAAIANSLGWHEKPHRPTFEDYYPRSVVRRFQEFVLTEKPDVLIFEYATQTQLLRSLSKETRNNLISVLDTHDVLWRRAQQFEQHGQEHWIQVDRTAEESAYREYDLLIAIQSEEANYFRALVGNEKVIVTSLEFENQSTAVKTSDSGDSVKLKLQDESNHEVTDQLSIGYLASNNWTNVDAAEQILKGWPLIAKQFPHVELKIAGSVCENESILNTTKDLPRIKILGRVENLREFYCEVDLIWNPIRFGTGLKIKNLEALAHAKCLVTSPHGAEGIGGIPTGSPRESSRKFADPIVILEHPEEMSSFLSGADSDIIRTMGLCGLKHLESNFGPGTQYPPLRQKIGTIFSKSKE